MQLQSVLNDMAAELAKGNKDKTCRVRQQLQTYAFSHGMPDSLVHQAQVSGLEATLDSGKGFWSRSHLITTNGPVIKQFAFWTAAFKWLEENA